MPLFRYFAIDKEGKYYSSVCTASSLEEAKRQLRQQGVLVRSMKLEGYRHPKLKLQELAALFHQISLLMQAGFPLYEALITLQEEYEQEQLKGLIFSLADQIHAGSTLADALATYPRLFDASLVAMIRAGERSASLISVLDRLSQVLSAQVRLQKQLVTAMIYPALLSIVCFAILLLMLLWVVPSLEPLFNETAPSSALTVAVFAISGALRHHGTLLLSLAAAGALGLLPWAQRCWRSGRWQQIAFRLPLVGSLLLRSRLARFGFAMEALLESGVPLVEALSMAAPLLQVGPLAPVIEGASAKVLQGQSLSQALSDPAMPKLLLRLVHLGENSGNLARSFAHLRELMDEELQKDLTRLTAAIQPVILVVMGVLVGLIMAAILIPLTDMGRFQTL